MEGGYNAQVVSLDISIEKLKCVVKRVFSSSSYDINVIPVGSQESASLTPMAYRTSLLFTAPPNSPVLLASGRRTLTRDQRLARTEFQSCPDFPARVQKQSARPS